VWEPDGGDVKFARQVRESLDHDRMDVKMQVAVDLGETKARAPESLELRANLPACLAPGFRVKLQEQSGQCRA
jgi:hypothetical protein